jgi:F0F1-type ATP synthase assembly protein I
MARPSKQISWRQALAISGMALALPWMIAIPAYLGWYLDQKQNSWPRWFIICFLIGLMSAAFDLYKLLKKFGQFK